MSRLDRFKNISSSSSWVSVWDFMTWLSAQVHINPVPFTKPMTFRCRWDIHYICQCQNSQKTQKHKPQKHFYEIVLTRCLVRREFLTGQCPSWAILVVTHFRLLSGWHWGWQTRMPDPNWKRKARWGFLYTLVNRKLEAHQKHCPTLKAK